MSNLKEIIKEIKNKDKTNPNTNLEELKKNVKSKLLKSSSLVMTSVVLLGSGIGYSIKNKEDKDIISPTSPYSDGSKLENTTNIISTTEQNKDLFNQYYQFEKQPEEDVTEDFIREEDKQNAITIWSFNLEMHNAPTIKNNEMYHWNNRRQYVVKQIEEYKPDIICFQEVTTTMNNFLKKELEGYEDARYIRRNSNPDEYSMAIYFSEDFEELDYGKFWFSDTPEVESKGWDPKHEYRICCWEKLKNKNTGAEFYVMNTHLTFDSSVRDKSCELILEQIKDFDAPVILVGDFNSNKNDSNYKIITREFDNANDVALNVVDEGTTFNGYDISTRKDTNPIDFIFCNGGKVLSYEVINDYTEDYINQFGNDKFAENADRPYAVSDHFPVSATIAISKDNILDTTEDSSNDLEIESDN